MIILKKATKMDYSRNHDKLLTLSEYTELAEHCIAKFAGGIMAHKMLRNEDAISFVIEHLIYGTCRWRKDGGRHFRSYLLECAKWAIANWKYRIKQQQQKPNIAYLSTINEDREQLPSYEEDLETQDYVEYIMDISCLTQKERDSLKYRFMYGMTYDEIGKKMGICREGARQHVQKGIKKLQVAANA